MSSSRNAQDVLCSWAVLFSSMTGEQPQAYLCRELGRDPPLRVELLAVLTEMLLIVARIDANCRRPKHETPEDSSVAARHASAHIEAHKKARRDKGFQAFMGAVTGGDKLT